MTKQTTAGHTELPWHYRVSGDGYVIRSKSSPGAIAGINGIRPVEEAEANAQLIVTAVNTYPAVTELVEALEAIQQFCDDPNGSEGCETLAEGLSRLLPQARSALTHYRELAGTSNEGAK